MAEIIDLERFRAILRADERRRRREADLVRYFDLVRGGMSDDVQSLQSVHEAQLGARMKIRKHRPVRAHDGRGRFLAEGTDIGCGDTAHPGTGIEYTKKPSTEPDWGSIDRARWAAPVTSALERLSPLHRLVLELRFDMPLRPCRIPFGLHAGDAPRGWARMNVPGVALQALRGHGEAAHLTAAAAEAFPGRDEADRSLAIDRAGNRLRHDQQEEEDRVPRKQRLIKASDIDRVLARRLEAAARELVEDAVDAFSLLSGEERRTARVRDLQRRSSGQNP